MLNGILLASDLSEERYFSCINQTVRLGPLPFVWKSFPSICGTLGRQIGAGSRWVAQSFGRKLEVPLGQDELALSFLTSAKPYCFWRLGYLLRQWNSGGKKPHLKCSCVLFKLVFLPVAITLVNSLLNVVQICYCPFLQSCGSASCCKMW